ANSVLHLGLNVEGRKVYTHKQLPEPNRCYNCHSWDQFHFARDCPKPTICGTCRANHPTDNCNISNPKEQFCINCNTKGHPALDHECKTFLEAQHKLQTTNTEAKYKFFPTLNDPTTWE
ncbi:hypothetical protein J3R82DRAFT_3649, partial [Butyriboletus roseoflavus]